MATPSNGITPEVIRDFMPPYHLSPDLLAATIAALPRPPPDSTTAWRQARLTRLFQEVTDLHPADAAQVNLAAQCLTTRELADAYKARAHTPDLESNQMCRLGRTADALLRSAATLECTLARRQKMPVAFFGVVVHDEVDIPALETIWAKGIPAAAGTGSPASTTAPPPATPQPATALDPAAPQPDPEPAPATPPQPQGAARPVARSGDTPGPAPGNPAHAPGRRQLDDRAARPRPRLVPRDPAPPHRRRPRSGARRMSPPATPGPSLLPP